MVNIPACHRTAINLRRALIYESVVNELTVSTCTARQARHENRTSYLFCVFLFSFIMKGPNKSAPVCVNGGEGLLYLIVNLP